MSLARDLADGVLAFALAVRAARADAGDFRKPLTGVRCEFREGDSTGSLIGVIGNRVVSHTFPCGLAKEKFSGAATALCAWAVAASQQACRE